MRNLVTTLFTSFLLISLNANEELQDEVPTAEVMQDDENVVVNSRPLSEKKKKLMEEKRRKEIEQIEEVAEDETLELSSLIIPIKNEETELSSLIIPIKNEETELSSLIIPIKNEEETQLSSLIIPIKGHEYAALVSNELNHTCVDDSSHCHRIDHFPVDNIIQTEDGAEWIFDSSNNYILRTWRPNDTVVITPKGKWLWGSNYSYVITNKNLGSSVDVNLFLGPVAFGCLSSWIVGIDLMLNQIYVLSGDGDRSVWEISSVDEYLFKEWEVNDTLIFGENDSWLWWFSAYNRILINVNMNHHVRAKLISFTPNYQTAGRG